MSLVARICGGAAGFGAVLAGLLHTGVGAPMLEHELLEHSNAAPALLQQTEAGFVSATLSMVLFGAVLIVAAVKQPSWLAALGPWIGLWFLAYGVAEEWGALRWVVVGLAPEAIILWVLALLTFAAAYFARPKSA